MAVLADEDEACPAVGHRQDDRLTRPSPDRLHPDDEKLTDWLVRILEPELRSDLSGRKSKTQALRTRIDITKRGSFAFKAEISARHGNKIYLRLPAAEDESWPGKNLGNQMSRAAPHFIHRITQSERIRERPYRDCLPRQDIAR
jgi:hypothetical protein